VPLLSHASILASIEFTEEDIRWDEGERWSDPAAPWARAAIVAPEEDDGDHWQQEDAEDDEQISTFARNSAKINLAAMSELLSQRCQQFLGLALRAARWHRYDPFLH
jgi:hypothetical protein